MSAKRRRRNNNIVNLVIIIALCCGGYYYIGNTSNPYSIYIAAIISISILLLPLIGKIIIKRFKRNKYLNSSLSQIDKMDGHEFERYLKEIYVHNGYTVKFVGEDGKDFGGDLIIWGGKEKMPKTVVQAKRYTVKNKVGIKAVQEVFSAKEYYDCKRAAVITSGYYTSAAVKLAEKCGIILLDRNDLYNDNWALG